MPRAPAPLELPLPEGCLDLPFRHERRRVLRFEAGLHLDPLLRRLARVSGAIDLSLAKGLRRLRVSRGYLRLGYARFADYVRERVDLSVRSAQEMVRLATGLERLPLLEAALAEGRVTWSAALTLVGAATPGDETRWIELAERVSVRDLHARVSESRGRASGAGGPRAAVDDAATNTDAGDDLGPTEAAAADSPEAVESDGLVRVRVSCRQRVARMWHASLELCEMVVGGPMAEGEAAEYVLAELLSGLRSGGETSHGASGLIPVARVSRNQGTARPRPVAFVSRELGGRALSRADLRRIRTLLDRVDSRVPDEAFAIDRWLRGLLRARSELQLDLARLLRLFRSFALARGLGFGGFDGYVAERLAISRDRARFLVRLDYRLSRFDDVKAAVRRGAIGTVAALLICRVAGDAESQRAWVERARRRTVVRLRQEVEWAERQAEATGHPVAPPAPGRLPSDLDHVTAEVRGEMSARPESMGWPVDVDFALRESALEAWKQAREGLRALAGGRWVSDEQVLYEAALAFLRTYLPLWVEHLEHGDPIAVRDRFRCQAPGCTHRCGSGHHVRFRSHGGSDDPANLVFLCHVHHLQLVHALGAIRVRGSAPDRLVFELGFRPDGTALEVFVNGERAVETSENRQDLPLAG